MTTPQPLGAPEFPAHRSRRQLQRFGDLLRRESLGGLLLVIAAVIAIVWANSPFAETYFALRDYSIGYAPWHLELSLGAWAADGLLAIFFFLVGVELKREFIVGDLRHVRTAIVPVAAAIGGVAVPALIFLALVGGNDELRRGWAIPTATDIAFALAVLALIGSHLPAPLRLFLLTLAVVDDLIAIDIIAIVYTETIALLPLTLALLTIVAYGFVAHRWRRLFAHRAPAAWLILLPLGVLAWAFMHASGIHATIAGVLLGFAIPVTAAPGDDERDGLATRFEHRFRPLSAGFAVPVFAFFSAGVAVGGGEGFASTLTAPLTIAIVIALVVGKPLGILATTFVVTTVARIRLDPSLRWVDLLGVGMVAGIGFTVSLLVTELSFTDGSAAQSQAKVAIVAAALISSALAACVLVPRNRRYRRAGAVTEPINRAAETTSTATNAGAKSPPRTAGDQAN